MSKGITQKMLLLIILLIIGAIMAFSFYLYGKKLIDDVLFYIAGYK